MTCEKIRGEIFFKVKDKQKGVKIDLTTGVLYSMTTGSPYKNQDINNIIRLFGNEPKPRYFDSSNVDLSTLTEPLAIMSLYFASCYNGEVQSFVRNTVILQMFYNRQFPITASEVLSISNFIRRSGHDTATVVNFAINNNCHNFGNRFVTMYTLSQSGIEANQLSSRQRDYVEYLVGRFNDREKILYIVRKLLAEHIDFVLNVDQIIQYFQYAEMTDTPYNQKNFLNAYASMAYTYEMKKSELMLKKVTSMQDDKFKFDSEEFYCYMPKTADEFNDMSNYMSNCIRGYYKQVAEGYSRIVFVYDRKTDRPIINIEIRKGTRGRNTGYHMEQFLGMQNDRSVMKKFETYYNNYAEYLAKLED